MTRAFDVFDEERALSYWKASLAGPYPEGVIEELGRFLDVAHEPLTKLREPHAAGPDIEDEDDPTRRV